MLSDLGADVVKLENPAHQDFSRSVPLSSGDQNHYFLAIDHGKRNVAADLCSVEGRALAFQLASKADVLVEYFRPGAIDRMGLGHRTLSAVNPRLIHCPISGLGQDGEAAKRPACDIVIQARSGFMSVPGERDGAPLRSGVSVGDMVAGLYAVQAIPSALYQRDLTGKGAALDVSMFDTLASMLSYYATLAQVSQRAPRPTGSHHATIVPLGNFQTSDGWIMVAATTEIFWQNLTKAICRADLLHDPGFVDLAARQVNRDALTALLDATFAKERSSHWARVRDEHDVPIGPVNDVLSLIASDMAAERRLFRGVGTNGGKQVQVTRYPVLDRSKGIPVEAEESVPDLGEHTDEIIAEWLGEGSTLEGRVA